MVSVRIRHHPDHFLFCQTRTAHLTKLERSIKFIKMLILSASWEHECPCKRRQ